MSSSTATRRPAAPIDPRQRGGARGGRGPSLKEQQRRRDRRARRLRRAAVLTAVLALVLGVGWLIGFSPVLATGTVSVTGTKLLSTETVRSAAAAPVGLPLVRQDTTAIADRVRALAPVESVTVHRAWPHTLRIDVVERVPVVTVQGPGGYQLVDHTGAAFQTVAQRPDGIVEAKIDSTNSALLVEAATIAAAVPADFRSQISSISAVRADSFRIKLDSGLTVAWGDSSDSLLKGQVAQLLLKQKPKAIDVSAPHSPAIR